jgi:hypothetical protein
LQNVHEVSSSSQENQNELAFSPLDSLITDLRALRSGMIATDRRRRSAILIGQLTLLASEYRKGRRPSRHTLKRFFHFVAREQAA